MAVKKTKNAEENSPGISSQSLVIEQLNKIRIVQMVFMKTLLSNMAIIRLYFYNHITEVLIRINDEIYVKKTKKKKMTTYSFLLKNCENEKKLP